MAEVGSVRAKARWFGALAVVTGVMLASVGSASAGVVATNGIDCKLFASKPCLVPFPNNLYTKKDKKTVTGRRVHLPQGAMPVGTGGPIDVGAFDMNDGFDPGSTIIDRVPGLDTPAAMAKTKPVPQSNIARYKDKKAPIVLINAKTGERQPIWVELDSTSPSVDTTTLLIHPAKLLPEGGTYIVALRHLKNAKGKQLRAPKWFELLRDGKKLPKSEKSQKSRYAKIFKSLSKAGIQQKSLYEAWDFTVASGKSLAGPMLQIRNDAFGKLGDHNLSDNVVSGNAPNFTVDDVTTTGLATGIAKEIEGTFQVPCYLTSTNCALGGAFNYGSGGGAYPKPTQLPGNMATAHYSCIIPTSATAANPARGLTYGHGLFGDDGEAVGGTGGNESSLAADHNFMSCGTEFWGLAGDDSGKPGTEDDLGTDLGVLADLSNFPKIGDRLQQGLLNFLFLGRLMRSTDGFATDAAFQDGSSNPVIDTDHSYYYGNSQGGIMGGAVIALSPDVRRGALGVPGTDYGGLLLQRSTDFVGGFDGFIKSSYTDTSQYSLVLDLTEQLWDRGEAEAYAENMTTDPLPDTPSHKVLMHVAYGDHQVSMYAAAVEARTIGAKAYEPNGNALESSRQAHDANLFYGIKPISSLPFDGSGIVVWDSGPGRVSPPPFGNIQPAESDPQTAPNFDPHSDPRKTPAARQQISDFLNDATGTITDQCANAPCRTSSYVP
jgi:hypothetical protein